MLLAYLTEIANRRSIRLRPCIFILSAVGLICSLSGLGVVAQIIVTNFHFATSNFFLDTTPLASNPQNWCGTPVDIPRVACFRIGDDRVKVTRFLLQNTSKDERIFVGLGRHDKIFVNDNLIYFAAGRMPATRWHHFDPGLQTDAEIQAYIIDELQTVGVRYIVLTSEWDEMNEPNGSSISSNVFLLDSYIRKNYTVMVTFGVYKVLTRNQLQETSKDVGP